MKRAAVVQSSYLPWRGYFDLIRLADVFVFLDGVQFTRRDWRTRNRIKLSDGLHWLSVPVTVASHFDVLIREVRIDNAQPWPKKHLSAIRHGYARAPYFSSVYPVIEELLREPPEFLFQLNRRLTQTLWQIFSGGLPKEFVGDEQFGDLSGFSPNQRLIAICREVGASLYLSGPSAREYMTLEDWSSAGIAVHFMSYGYRPYPQQYGTFEPQTSIIDVLMNLGPGCLEQALLSGEGEG